MDKAEMNLRDFTVVGPTTALIILLIIAGLVALFGEKPRRYWLAGFFFADALERIRIGTIRLTGGQNLSDIGQQAENSFTLKIFSDDMAYLILCLFIMVMLFMTIRRKQHYPGTLDELIKKWTKDREESSR